MLNRGMLQQQSAKDLDPDETSDDDDDDDDDDGDGDAGGAGAAADGGGAKRARVDAQQADSEPAGDDVRALAVTVSKAREMLSEVEQSEWRRATRMGLNQVAPTRMSHRQDPHWCNYRVEVEG